MSVLGLYIPFFEPRIIPELASIHVSVNQRRGTPHDYEQPNLPDTDQLNTPLAAN